jgi:hypothetical protein
MGRRWPVAGGGYHRLLPWPVIDWAVRSCLRQSEPFMAYCHPYEFDASEFSTLELDIPFRTRLHQGLGRRGFRPKFERLLTNFRVVPAHEVALQSEWPEYSPERHGARN